MALAAEPFKNPVWHIQQTGGSSSIRHRWDMLRKVGAAARQMLLEAAADAWGIGVDKLAAQDSKVIHPDGRSLSYGQLIAAAAKRPVPKDPPVKNSKDYRIMGTKRLAAGYPGQGAGQDCIRL